MMRFESMLYNIEVNRETTIIKKENISKKIEKLKKEANKNEGKCLYTIIRRCKGTEKTAKKDSKIIWKSAKRGNLHENGFLFSLVLESFNNVWFLPFRLSLPIKIKIVHSTYAVPLQMHDGKKLRKSTLAFRVDEALFYDEHEAWGMRRNQEKYKYISVLQIHIFFVSSAVRNQNIFINRLKSHGQVIRLPWT